MIINLWKYKENIKSFNKWMVKSLHVQFHHKQFLIWVEKSLYMCFWVITVVIYVEEEIRVLTVENWLQAVCLVASKVSFGWMQAKKILCVGQLGYQLFGWSEF